MADRDTHTVIMSGTRTRIMNKSSSYAVIESVPEVYQPAYALTDPVHFPGEVEKKRRMVVLRTNGCEYDRDRKSVV